MDFKHKLCVITGASSGSGYSIAAELARRDARLILLAAWQAGAGIGGKRVERARHGGDRLRTRGHSPGWTACPSAVSGPALARQGLQAKLA